MRDEMRGNDLGRGQDCGNHFLDSKESFSLCWRLWNYGIYPFLMPELQKGFQTSGICCRTQTTPSHPQSPKSWIFFLQSCSQNKAAPRANREFCRSPGLFLTIPTFLSWTSQVLPLLNLRLAQEFYIPGFHRMRKGLRGPGAARGSHCGSGSGG